MLSEVKSGGLSEVERARSCERRPLQQIDRLSMIDDGALMQHRARVLVVGRKEVREEKNGKEKDGLAEKPRRSDTCALTADGKRE